MTPRTVLLALTVVASLLAETPLASSRVQQQVARLPLHFEPAAAGTFSARGRDFVVAIAGSTATLQMRSAKKDGASARVRMQLVDGLPSARPQGTKPQSGVVNYLLGNDPRQWRHNVPTFAEVRVPSVRPGVDLVYYGNQSQLEYDLVVAPGADPTPLAWSFSGHQSLTVTPDGGLTLATAAGPVAWGKPDVYQMREGKRLSVSASYRIVSADRAGFQLGAYDPSLPLVIDPVLEYSTVLGGQGYFDWGRGVAVDSLGQAYVVGFTDRPDFPTRNAPYPGQQGGKDVFITKLNPAGTAIVFSTYIGGSGDEEGLAIALDNASTPNVYITGHTASNNFPIVGGAQPANAGGTDAFLVKLNSSGSAIDYSSYHGGSGRDWGSAVGVDNVQGEAYIAGWTDSTNLPVNNALQPAKANGDDGFVAKFRFVGNTRRFSTYLGGNNSDYLHGLAVDAAGNVYVSGLTASTDYPNDGGIQPSYRGSFDALITKLNPSGSARIYSHVLGGSGYDQALGVTVDATGAAYLTGSTRSPEFPVLAAHQPNLGGETDFFVTKINPAGTALVYSTFLGGPNHEWGLGIGVDSAGRAHVAGHSQGRLTTLNAITPQKPGGSFAMFRSSNNGATLLPAESGLETAPGPDFPLVVFESASVAYTFGANGDTYKSTNAGANWTTLGPAGTLQGSPQATVSIGANALWVGTNSSLFLSTNGGATWAARTAGLPANPNVTALAFNPANTAELFVGLDSGGIFRTTNAGLSWSAVNTGLGNLTIRSLFLNPANPSDILAGTQARTYRTANSGASWTLFGPDSLSNLSAIYRHPVSGSIFGLSNETPVVSDDNGTTWRNLEIPIPWGADRLLVHPTNPQILLISRKLFGIWRSTNQGLSWSLVSEGDASALSLAFAPGDPNTFLASMVLLRDAVVARFEPNGTLNYLTYLGGEWWDMAHGIAVDPGGSAYIVGDASSASFPTTANAFRSLPRPQDAFVAKIAVPLAIPDCGYQVSRPQRTLYPYPNRAGDFFRVASPSGCPWTAVSSAPWLTIINGANRSGVGSFSFNMSTNPGAANRTATITVGPNVIPIEQSGSTCAFNSNFPSTTHTFPVEGGSRTDLLTLPAGCPWTAQSDADWLSISPSAGNGSATIGVLLTPNPSRTSRSAFLTIGPGFLTINQDGVCSVRFSSPGNVATPSAGTGSFELLTGAGCPWTLGLSNSNLFLTSPTSGTGPATVTYAFGNNPSPAPRFGSIFITNGPNHSLIQNGASCIFSLPLSAQTIAAGGSTLSVSVFSGSGCGFTASSPAPWAALTSGPIHVIPSQVAATFAIAPNPGPGPRVTTLTVAGQPFTLTQSGPACQLGLTPSTTTATSAGLNGTLTIGTSSASCSWTATSSAPWLRITSSTSGSGNAALNFTVDPNAAPAGRSGTLTVNGQSIAITQSGTAPCASSGFSLSQSTESILAPGGARTVQLTAPAGCPWTATSSDPWVSLPASGNGSAPIAFNVQPNAGTSSRIATLTIAGQPFTVTQSGTATLASCTLAATPLPVRAEGRTEAVADLYLNCTALPLNLTADIELSLNTTVTNTTNADVTDAALSLNGGPASFAQFTGPSSLRWPGLRLPAGNSVIRLSNIRVDASLLVTPATLAPVPVLANLLLNSALPIPVPGSQATVATVSPGLLVQAGTPSLNGAYRVLPVLLSEGFASAFRASSGENTRLRVVFPSLPAGVRLFAPVFASSGSAQLHSADANGFGGTALPGSPINGVAYQELLPGAGPLVATWRISSANASNVETITLPFLVQSASDSQFGELLASFSGALAPVSPLSAFRPGAVVPRFRDLTAPQRRSNLRITSRIVPASAPTTSKVRALFAVNAPVAITLTVTNESEQPAPGTIVRNNLPTGLLLNSCSNSCTSANGQLSFALGTLAPGETRTLNAVATVGPLLTQGGAVSNWATVESDDSPANLASASTSASIDLLPGPPSVALPEPISGTGLTKTFVLRYSNPNGFQRLGILNALINSALDGGNACYIAYSVPAGILFLVNDRGVADGLSAPLVLGTNNSVSNSQCVINGLNSSAFGSGNDFTLTLEITFRPAFSGSKIVYLAARDEQERNSGWTSSGFHQVPGGTTTFPNPQMAPPIGTTASGILSFTYEDQTNNVNLQTLWALTNTALDGRNACYIVYFAPGNLIGVVPDNGDGGALSLIPLSGSATTGNSQCQINTFGSSVVRTGNRLTLNLNMTFRPAFSGNRIVWMAGQTVTGQVSPWKASGAWQVPP